ncbi:MAG: ACT domain-containing protein [Candidatus Omnitrophota bacterium]
MANCVKVKELVITTMNRAGMLSEVTSVMASNGINITALCAYTMEDNAIFMILTSDNKKAKAAAESKGWKIEENEVVALDLADKVGAAKEIGDKLKAKNINLSYCYGTTCACATDCACRLVLKSDDNDAIIAALK